MVLIVLIFQKKNNIICGWFGQVHALVLQFPEKFHSVAVRRGKDTTKIFGKLESVILKVFLGEFRTHGVLEFSQGNHLVNVDSESRVNRDLDVGITCVHPVFLYQPF